MAIKSEFAYELNRRSLALIGTGCSSDIQLLGKPNLQDTHTTKFKRFSKIMLLLLYYAGNTT